MFSFGASPSTCCARSDQSSSISRHLSSGPSDCTSGNLSRSINEDIPQNARSRIQPKFAGTFLSSFLKAVHFAAITQVGFRVLVWTGVESSTLLGSRTQGNLEHPLSPPCGPLCVILKYLTINYLRIQTSSGNRPECGLCEPTEDFDHRLCVILTLSGSFLGAVSCSPALSH
jgi:hypothetical protein